MKRNVTITDRLYRRGLAVATKALVEPVLGARYLTLADAREQWWTMSPVARDQWRAEALDSILRYAVSKVPAYRHLSPDFERFPIVDKHDFVADPDAYLSDEHDRLPTVAKYTGGSTGDPWNYPLDLQAWAENYATQIYRFREYGVHYGDKRVLLGFPASLGLQEMDRIKRIRLRAERTEVSLSGFQVDRAASLARAREAVAVGARLWYGYASTIATMASAVLDAGRTLPGPDLIVTMAEPLWPSWRRDIADAFGSTVVEEYGCNDGGIMSHRCHAGNFHLADHQSLVEVLDDHGEPCPPGVDGSIVITNFHARHLPFIRYRVGDIGALGPDACACGRPGRTLSRVTGRSGDLVRLPDGTELVPATFFRPFNQVGGVRRWQLVQPDPDSLVVRIEPRRGWGDDDRNLVMDWIREQTGDQLAVQLTDSEPFELTSGGKHKVIVRHF